MLEGRLAEQFCRTVRSHLASFNMAPMTMCFGALRGRPPSNRAIIGNARQAGKSGPVETGLTGPAATALDFILAKYNLVTTVA